MHELKYDCMGCVHEKVCGIKERMIYITNNFCGTKIATSDESFEYVGEMPDILVELSCAHRKEKSPLLLWNNPKKIIFETYIDAEKVLMHLKNILQDYGVVTVSDLLDMLGKPSRFRYDAIGWRNLDDASIIKEKESFYIDFPTLGVLK